MQFWQLTPRESQDLIEAYEERALEESKELIAGAWFTALYTRAKKMPRLEEALRGLGRKQQSPEDMLAKVRAAAKILGGEVRTHGGN